MATYVIVASTKSPLGPNEIRAGKGIAVNDGDRFILDPSANAGVTFTAAGGKPASFAVEIAQTNAATFDLKFGKDLNPSVAIADGVRLSNIRLDAQEAASASVTAGNGVTLSAFKGAIGPNSFIAGDGFTLRGDLQTQGGADTISFGANANLQNIDTGGGNDDLRLGDNARAGEIKLGDGNDVIRVGANASIGKIDGGNGSDTLLTQTIPAAQDVKNIETVEVVCFAEGTRIYTAEGPVAVEELRPGDLVMTLDHCMQPLRWVGSRRLDAAALEARPDLKPVRIRAGALGAGTPHRDLVVSPQHRVLLRSPIAQRMFGAAEILIAARKLVGIEGIEVLEDRTSVTYWHILFNRHEIVFAEGATTESLFTGPQAMKGLPSEAVDEILTLFPELADPAHRPEPARPIADKGRLTRTLVSRHVRNERPLVEEAL